MATMPLVEPMIVASRGVPRTPTLTPPLAAVALMPSPFVPVIVSAELVSVTLTEPVPVLDIETPVPAVTLPSIVTETMPEPPADVAFTPVPLAPAVTTPPVMTVTAPPPVEAALMPTDAVPLAATPLVVT